MSTGVRCPLCGAQDVQVFLECADVPVHQNLLCSSSEEARSIRGAELRFVLCRRCGFAFNSAFHSKLLSYSGAYDNTQTHSPLFQHYLESLVNDLIVRHELRGKTIVEVGCGKGDFLRLLCTNGRNRGWGFDPSYVGPAAAEEGSVRFVRDFYQPSQVPISPDLVCCRHVLEHIDCPLDLLGSIRLSVGPRKESVVYLEVPDLSWTLEQGAFWDMFYEHCSLFTEQTLTTAFRAAGFEVLGTQRRFGGQYLSVEAKPGKRAGPDVRICAPEDLPAKAARFKKGHNDRVLQYRRKVRELHRQGGCALWGAGAKGVTFANIVDPDMVYIRYVVDINPAKAGKFLPGTGHPIIGIEHLKDVAPAVKSLLSMNPTYLIEQRAMLHELGVNLPIEAVA